MVETVARALGHARGGIGQKRSDLPHDLGGHAGLLLGSPGSERPRVLGRLLKPYGAPNDRRLVIGAGSDQLVDQSPGQGAVGPRPHPGMDGGASGDRRGARVDDDERRGSAARDGDGVRHVRLGSGRVRAPYDDAGASPVIGHGVRAHREAIAQVAGDGAHRVVRQVVRRAHSVREPAREALLLGEPDGLALPHAEASRPVAPLYRRRSLGDLIERVLQAHLDPAPPDALQRSSEAVRVMDHLHGGARLDAHPAAVIRVLPVATDVDHAAVSQVHLDTAAVVAHATQCLGNFSTHHRPDQASFLLAGSGTRTRSSMRSRRCRSLLILSMSLRDFGQ